ncbi:MAG: hypothetical protein OMM_10067 [Candidatus Magnetoglobus multicellularis str. Araruama]|uniref:Uncharacterized protein n=1 Tax=Candidatus Magnetoglobus multicellularis str. Araruama TaxID=890399 RepID=A0A1V1P277_9BACT|nr:MAG: hypothetical protein OMM_10067 [Candidatus Magnetoglobus multicellularis str. Araruama]
MLPWSDPIGTINFVKHGNLCFHEKFICSNYLNHSYSQHNNPDTKSYDEQCPKSLRFHAGIVSQMQKKRTLGVVRRTLIIAKKE